MRYYSRKDISNTVRPLFQANTAISEFVIVNTQIWLNRECDWYAIIFCLAAHCSFLSSPFYKDYYAFLEPKQRRGTFQNTTHLWSHIVHCWIVPTTLPDWARTLMGYFLDNGSSYWLHSCWEIVWKYPSTSIEPIKSPEFDRNVIGLREIDGTCCNSNWIGKTQR
jgi:hypothetical protein